MVTENQVWAALTAVKDPEIPVVSVVEMGIVRAVDVVGDAVTVTMTPTFSGCPALHVMQADIETAVRNLGVTTITVNTVLYPAWSSDWINDAAREKLRRFGLAPPPKHGGNLIAVASLEVVNCPRCHSSKTSLKNSFGSTLCRMIWYCHECQDAFEQFKPL